MKAILRLFGRFQCWRTRHARGKLVSENDTHKTFECPRCGRVTKRAIRIDKPF